MKQNRQEVIGTFTVVDSQQETKKIIVCQEIMTHYRGKVRPEKSFYLNFVDGIEVSKTIDPNIFRLPDGSKLRKRML